MVQDINFSCQWHYFLSHLFSNVNRMKINMKIKALMLMALVAFATPSFSAVSEPGVPVTETPDAVSRLSQRLEEIKEMDRSTLSRAERKALRVEVRSIKKEMAAMSGGVYISVGANLLNSLLLILLF